MSGVHILAYLGGLLMLWGALAGLQGRIHGDEVMRQLGWVVFLVCLAGVGSLGALLL